MDGARVRMEAVLSKEEKAAFAGRSQEDVESQPGMSLRKIASECRQNTMRSWPVIFAHAFQDGISGKDIPSWEK
jgi:hypothetical protein